jgi:predicted membrane metal-binding protein
VITLSVPLALFLAGFLLSFGATFGVIVFALLMARYEGPPEPGALTLEEALAGRERIIDAEKVRWN